MDQTTALVVGGSFQTSYADDVVTASNGPACTSASANPACAAATSAWALTTSGRSDAPASACSLDCASTGGAAGAATLTLSVRRRPMDARSPVNEVSTWFLAAIRSTWAAARAACTCSTSALAAMPARTCASACRLRAGRLRDGQCLPRHRHGGMLRQRRADRRLEGHRDLGVCRTSGRGDDGQRYDQDKDAKRPYVHAPAPFTKRNLPRDRVVPVP